MTRMPAIIVLASALAGASSDAQTPVFRTGIDRVRVDVLVTDDDRPITGMSVREFAIWDSGVPQTVQMIERGGPVKVLLVLDVSGSVAGSELERLRAASMKLLDALNEDDEVGLLTFSERLEQSVPLTREHDAIRQVVTRLDAGGRTALFDAVFTGLTMGLGESGRWLVLVFSDGADTASWLEGERVLEAAQRSSVVVYGITSVMPDRGPDSEQWLQTVAGTTGGRVISAGATDLGRLFVEVLNEYRARYVLAYTPEDVPRGDGWHPIKVRLRGPKASRLRVTARTGYLSTN
jgi:Ca-activated chloride channel homolog